VLEEVLREATLSGGLDRHDLDAQRDRRERASKVSAERVDDLTGGGVYRRIGEAQKLAAAPGVVKRDVHALVTAEVPGQPGDEKILIAADRAGDAIARCRSVMAELQAGGGQAIDGVRREHHDQPTAAGGHLRDRTRQLRDVKESPRKEFIYWSDDGDLMAIRIGNWKAAFMEQNSRISPETPIGVWQGEFTKLRGPNLYNLRSDPFERSGDSIYKGDWQAKRSFMLVPAQAAAAQWLSSFKEFPPRQKPASFNLDDVMRKMSEPQTGSK